MTAKIVVFEFDIPMADINVPGENITVRYGNFLRTLTFDDYPLPTRATYSHILSGIQVGDNVSSYIGPEMLFMSTEGIPAVPWTDFPITKATEISQAINLSIPGFLQFVFDSNLNQTPFDPAGIFFRQHNISLGGAFIDWLALDGFITQDDNLGPDMGADITNSASIEGLIIDSNDYHVDEWKNFPTTHIP